MADRELRPDIRQIHSPSSGGVTICNSIALSHPVLERTIRQSVCAEQGCPAGESAPRPVTRILIKALVAAGGGGALFVVVESAFPQGRGELTRVGRSAAKFRACRT